MNIPFKEDVHIKSTFGEYAQYIANKPKRLLIETVPELGQFHNDEQKSIVKRDFYMSPYLRNLYKNLDKDYLKTHVRLVEYYQG